MEIKLKKLLLMVMWLYTSAGWAQIPPSDPSYSLMLYDTFDTLVTSDRWLVLNDDNWSGGGVCFTNRSNNVSITSGTLELKLQHESPAYTCTPCKEGDGITPKTTYTATSGHIDLKSKYYFKYGYMEARIKLPYIPNSRLWPAFWTKIGYGLPPPYHSVDEIDIFEEVQIITGGGDYQDDQMIGAGIFLSYGYSNNGTTNTVCASASAVKDYTQAAIPYSYTTGATGYHIYAAEWSPASITWYFDGIPIRKYNNPSASYTYAAPPEGCNYNGGGIHDLVMLILDLSYQGDASISFPQTMYVDYLKVYQLKPDCSTNINVTSGNYSFTGYDSKVKGYINIGGSGVTTSWPASPAMSLKADQYIQLGEGFATPSGGDIYIDVPGCPQ
jgi:beta-glucanase (GH16 family)